MMIPKPEQFGTGDYQSWVDAEGDAWRLEMEKERRERFTPPVDEEEDEELT